MKEQIKNFVPKKCFYWLQSIRRPWARAKLRRIEKTRLKNCYHYDLERFWNHSPGSHLIMATPEEVKASETQMEAMMTLNYHSIEKGLAHPAPRPGFGRAKIDQLCEQTNQFINLYGYKPIVDVCLNAMTIYAEHASNGGEPNLALENYLAIIKQQRDNSTLRSIEKPTLEISRKEIHAKGRMDLTQFFASRYSIRNFSPKNVPNEKIRRAVIMASKTPSVCNRQSTKVYIIDEPEDRTRVLALQSGNRGFGHTASKVLIITSDTQCFLSFEERNQCWVDGGLFAMSLIYALHSLGLGTCSLNWCAKLENDRELRRITKIPESEAIIMMIAVGHIAEHLKVARSVRRPPEEIMFHLRDLGN